MSKRSKLATYAIIDDAACNRGGVHIIVGLVHGLVDQDANGPCHAGYL